jgi:hypothetical protein
MEPPEALTVPLLECAVCCKTFVPADAAGGRAVCSHCGAHNFDPAPAAGERSTPPGADAIGDPLACGWLGGGRTLGALLVRH